MREFVIRENEAGQRFDKYLAKRMEKAPKSFFYKMLRKKNITLNHKKAAGNEILKAGDLVNIFVSEETFRLFCEEPGPDRNPVRGGDVLSPDIVYEDRQILLLNKPEGRLSQPDRTREGSLVGDLTAYLLRTGQIAEEELATFHPSVCNRLDRNTTGLVAAGKTLPALQELSAMFRDRRIRKFYLCLCEGEIKKENYIKGYLHKSKKYNKVIVRTEPEAGDLAVETRYRPLQVKNGKTLLEVELLTGRSHQIRAHLSSIGHPIHGDPKYGSGSAGAHQLLHAYRMVFPASDGVLAGLSGKTFFAPLPESFLAAMKKYDFEEKTCYE